jgi:hypothetical protein
MSKFCFLFVHLVVGRKEEKWLWAWRGLCLMGEKLKDDRTLCFRLLWNCGLGSWFKRKKCQRCHEEIRFKKDCSLLGCDTTQSDRSLPTFRRKVLLLSYFTLGMEAARSSETSVMIHQTIRYHITEDSNFLVMPNGSQISHKFCEVICRLLPLKDPGFTEEDHS